MTELAGGDQCTRSSPLTSVGSLNEGWHINGIADGLADVDVLELRILDIHADPVIVNRINLIHLKLCVGLELVHDLAQNLSKI